MARKWWTLTAVCVGVFMLLLDVTIVNVALPDIQDRFHASLSDLQWVIDAYALTLAAALLTAGSLADLWGRRAMFAAGTVVFTAGSLLCGLATGTLFLSLARAGQGIGGAVMFATSLALLSDAFRGRDRAAAFGVFGAVTGVAVAVGPVLGGVITSGLGWRWIFLVNIPVGIAAIAITLTRVAESRDPGASRPDWLGFATFSGALGSLVYGLISSSEGWRDTKVVMSLAVAGVLLVAFVIIELVQPRPMLDLALFRKPTFTGGLIAAFAISASLFSLLTYLVLYLQNQLGYSALQSGLRFLVLTGAIFVTAGVAGRLTTSVPVGWMIGSGFALIGAGLLLMRGVTVTSTWTHLIPGLLLAGVGAGLVNVPLASTAVGIVEPARAGMASGINSTLRQVGIATGIATLGSLFTARLRDTAAHELAGTTLGSQAHRIAAALGGAPGALDAVPLSARQLVEDAARTGFVDGLNRILLIGAVIALTAAVTSVLLIRARDFVTQDAPREAGPAEEAITSAPARHQTRLADPYASSHTT
jgi:EmrB/QacA subfamily drug resistance transporter